jgi:hypothetical protein|tara:strand:+ start:4009 stop:4884 length:876 start_codon:yes stop_codon:yes gene_type:complete
LEYINTHNLPAPLANAIKRDTYSKGDAVISATGLMRPARMSALFDHYDDQIQRDVTTEVWSLFGRAVHWILEQGETEGYITEERFFATCEGWRVSGQLDVQETQEDGSRVIQDYKTRKVYGVMHGGSADEEQLNIYAWLARQNGIEISGLQIINLIKDWSKHQVNRVAGYPERDVHIQNINMWTPEEADAFVRERVLIHKRARDGDLPECTDDERWYRGEKFAVRKEGRKTAVRVFNLKEEAETFISALKDNDKHSVEHRLGINMRCESYCDVSEYCFQYQSIKVQNEQND